MLGENKVAGKEKINIKLGREKALETKVYFASDLVLAKTSHLATSYMGPR